MNNRLEYISRNVPSLRDALTRKHVKMSIGLSPRAKLSLPSSLTLWTDNGPGLRIFSQMIDIGKFNVGHGYLEEGILSFEYIEELESDQILIDLPEVFQSEVNIEKLVLHFADMAPDNDVDLIVEETEYETGIRFTTLSGDSLVILSNAMPYCLAMKCSFHEIENFDCNYDLAVHKQEPL